MNACKKAINFDLSTTALKEYFGENRATAYNAIKKFLLDRGFTHRQYSGYISNEKMDDHDIQNLTMQLKREFVWIGKCIQEFDVTDIGEQHTLKHILEEDFAKLNEVSPKILQHIKDKK